MKIYMVSLGCAKNQVDTEMLLGSLKKTSELTESPEDADLIIVNTCAFIEPARKEAIDTILSLADYKNDHTKLVVCGCLPQRYKEDIVSLLPEVDRFISIDEYRDFTKIINDVVSSSYATELEFSPLNRVYSTPDYMRYVKISEGCLHRCAFCAIPLIRGKLKSRTIESIVEEVKSDINDGVYEINLISQDTTMYGLDLYKKLSLVDLLTELVKIPGDFKIRLLYLYPDIVTDELIEFIKSNKKVIPYFDIPIQHSEDIILKKMLRRGDKEFIVNLFKKIKESIPHAILRTTLIVGFPYEEEKDVDSLIEFIKEIKFDRLGAFTFSLEENTYAENYPNIISEAIKQDRYERLMKAQEEIALELNQKLLGTIIDDVFVIDYDQDNFMYVARADGYAPDDVDGYIYLASKRELNLGERVSAKVLDCDAYSLTCELVENEN